MASGRSGCRHIGRGTGGFLHQPGVAKKGFAMAALPPEAAVGVRLTKGAACDQKWAFDSLELVEIWAELYLEYFLLVQG